MNKPPFDQRLAARLVRPLVGTPVSPNHITLLTLVLAFGGCWLMATGPLLWGATLFCLANLFTAQWAVNERINFPLLQMPKLLAEAYDQQRLFSFLADPFLLCGLCIPVVLHLMGGLSAHIPSIPALPTEILAGPDCS